MVAPRPLVVLLMVIVIVLIGVYLLGVGLGSGRARPSMDDLQASFTRLLGAPSQVACADLSATAPGGSRLTRCRCDGAGRILVPPPGCTAAVGSTLPWRRRTLTLSSFDRGALKVEVSSDEGRTVVRGDLEKPSDFPVPPGGATLSLACATSACQAVIQR